MTSTDQIDIDAADEITIDTTSADGHIAITSAHTAGQSILISANANAGSILDIDAGILDIDVQGAATINAVGITLTGTAQIGGLLKATNLTSAKGTDIENDNSLLTLSIGDHGKTFFCLLNNNGKTIKLPASTTVNDIGTQITIIQNANLELNGILTIKSNTDNTFCVNSYYSGMNSGARIASTRPADANNTIVITGANTNSAWGIGSVAVFTCVAEGEWHFAIRAEALGDGSNAVAFSTV